MKEFTYTITDPLGIHIRSAGLLSKTARDFDGTVVTIAKDGQPVRASQLMKLMGLGVRQGDQVTVSADGPAEEEALAAMEQFFRENL